MAKMRPLLAIVVGLSLLSSCGVTSIDSVVDRKLKMCHEIRDEALRVDCIKHADDGRRDR